MRVRLLAIREESPSIFIMPTLSVSLLRVSALALFAAACAAQESPVASTPAPLPWRLDASVNYSRGDYGLATDTEVYVGLLNVVYDTPRWRFQAALPVVSIEGPATAVAGGAGVGTRPTSSRETGVGDVTLGATYKFGEIARSGVELDFTGQVKLPTADEERGLGTGKTDTYWQLDARRRFGRVTPFATLGYRFLGSSSTYPLKDGFYATLGVAIPVTARLTAGAAINWRERIVAGGDESVDAMIFAQQTITERWRALVYVLAGFTDASPDFGLGAGVTFRF